MILTVLPVPPPPVRPSIAVDGGAMRSEDDLTYKLGEIIKSSANVRKSEQEGSPQHIISEFEQLLQVCSRLFYAYLLISILKNDLLSSMSQHIWITTLLAFRKHYKSLVDLSKLFARA
jgi:hypothetical protein